MSQFLFFPLHTCMLPKVPSHYINPPFPLSLQRTRGGGYFFLTGGGCVMVALVGWYWGMQYNKGQFSFHILCLRLISSSVLTMFLSSIEMQTRLGILNISIFHGLRSLILHKIPTIPTRLMQVSEESLICSMFIYTTIYHELSCTIVLYYGIYCKKLNILSYMPFYSSVLHVNSHNNNKTKPSLEYMGLPTWILFLQNSVQGNHPY